MSVRKPRQERSQERVAAILDAARDLIRANGAARLTMRAIASKAGISMGSIYQYFPDKGSIVAALCDRALAENRAAIDTALTPAPSSCAALLEACVGLMWSYHQLLIDEPVLGDIWSAYAADKALHDVEAIDGSAVLNLILERSAHLFPTHAQPQAHLSMGVLFQMCSTAVDRAARRDRDASAEIMGETEAILRAAWAVRIASLSMDEE